MIGAVNSLRIFFFPEMLSNPMLIPVQGTLNVVMNQNVSLSCHSDSGTPPVRYTLFKHNQKISTLNRLDLTPGLFNLTINSASDVGEYKCKAENNISSGGKYSKSLNFTLKGMSCCIPSQHILFQGHISVSNAMYLQQQESGLLFAAGNVLDCIVCLPWSRNWTLLQKAIISLGVGSAILIQLTEPSILDARLICQCWRLTLGLALKLVLYSVMQSFQSSFYRANFQTSAELTHLSSKGRPECDPVLSLGKWLSSYHIRVLQRKTKHFSPSEDAEEGSSCDFSIY